MLTERKPAEGQDTHPGGATAAREPEPRGEEPMSRPAQEIWTLEVDRLFAAAVHELRRHGERALAAAEQRRVAEITELSDAIRKQHAVIEALKRELAQARQAAALSLSEAEQQWQRSAAEQMEAERKAWESDKEELLREAQRHRSVAEQLADQLAALKANGENKERQFWERLKEITAEVDRTLLRARAEWENELGRMADGPDWKLPSFLTKGGQPNKAP